MWELLPYLFPWRRVVEETFVRSKAAKSLNNIHTTELQLHDMVKVVTTTDNNMYATLYYCDNDPLPTTSARLHTTVSRKRCIAALKEGLCVKRQFRTIDL